MARNLRLWGLHNPLRIQLLRKNHDGIGAAATREHHAAVPDPPARVAPQDACADRWIRDSTGAICYSSALYPSKCGDDLPPAGCTDGCRSANALGPGRPIHEPQAHLSLLAQHLEVPLIPCCQRNLPGHGDTGN